VPYWGFNAVSNLCTQLATATSLPCYVATVGPISSNRERAAELYASIRGLRTDYGQLRSSTWGFSRYAPSLTSMDFSNSNNAVNLLSPKQAGYLPNWCVGNNTDTIHFVGHSLGGPTIRMLERLIRLGDPSEVATSGASNVSALYNNATGGPLNGYRASCIKSLTTIATLHDGSPLHSVLGGSVTQLVKDLILGIAGYATLGGQFFNTTTGNAIYDFDVDRIPGMAVQPTESVTTWSNRLLGSTMFATTYNATAAYDLSPEFMRSFNLGGPTTFPGTYYFSASTGNTGNCGYIGGSCPIFWPYVGCSIGVNCCVHQCPNVFQANSFFQLPPAIFGDLGTMYSMGCLTGGGTTPWPYNFYTCNAPIHGAYDASLTFTSDQEENDGLVSRKGARGPHMGMSSTGAPASPQQIATTHNSGRSFGVQPVFTSVTANQWWYNDYQYDHMQAVGLFASLPPYTWANSLGLTPDKDIFVDIAAFINHIK